MSTYVVIVDQYIEEFKYRDKILWFILYCKTEFTAKKQKTKKTNENIILISRDLIL